MNQGAKLNTWTLLIEDLQRVSCEPKIVIRKEPKIVKGSSTERAHEALLLADDWKTIAELCPGDKRKSMYSGITRLIELGYNVKYRMRGIVKEYRLFGPLSE